MDTVNGQGPHPALDSSAPLQLVRAAAALRWKRPDLTATLAELAVDAADDAATWVAAAGWLLHGRSALGDGREVACDLLDGLGRWGEAGVELMAGPQGRRLRVELAGPARRSGEPSAVQALLAAEPGVDDLEGELRPDVLTELARCAIDDAPETAAAALDAAEQAWLAAGCEPGVASVLLLRAAHERRAGRPDAAVAVAAGGLARVNAGGRRAGGTESDHLAAALTAEWIAALVDVGRMDDARGEALATASRLVGTARPSRQLAGLRLAVARVTAVDGGAGAVLAALEPAARDAADSDVPDLESACRSMLGELHEAAGRLDEALSAVRAAMAAERRDYDRAARLRKRLAAVTGTWARKPSSHEAIREQEWRSSTAAAIREAAALLGAGPGHSPRVDATHDVAAGADAGGSENGSSSDPAPTPDGADRTRAHASNPGATGSSRRARRLAAESAEAVGWSDAAPPELGTTASARPGATRKVNAAPAATTDTGRSVAVGRPAGSGSLIGDALFRELVGDAVPESTSSAAGPAVLPSADAEPSARPVGQVDPALRDTVVFERDPRLGSTVAVPSVHPAGGSGSAASVVDTSAPSTDGSADQRPATSERGAASPDGGRRAPSARRRDSVVDDTIRVGPALSGGPRARRNGHSRSREPGSGDGSAAGAPESSGSWEQGRRPGETGAAPGAGRPRPTDTDGLGLGDLLASALAAYRSI